MRSLHDAILDGPVDVGDAKAGLCDDAESGEKYPNGELIHGDLGRKSWSLLAVSRCMRKIATNYKLVERSVIVFIRSKFQFFRVNKVLSVKTNVASRDL